MARFENRTVPYPQQSISSPSGQLEVEFMNLAFADDLSLDYYNLPQTIRSTGVDSYLTWLNQLTVADPEARERGSYIHLRVEDGALIFPDNPTLGGRRDVLSPFSLNPQRFFPLIRAHSHPGYSCFSPRDLVRFMSNPFAISEGVGTLDANYLLLRTKQTKAEDLDEVVKLVDDFEKFTLKSGRELYQSYVDEYAEEFPNINRSATYNYILDQERLVLKRDSVSHFASFSLTRTVASNFNLGFYVSLRNGEFQLFDDSMYRTVRSIGGALIPRHGVILNREQTLENRID